MLENKKSRFIAAMDLLQEEVKKGPLTLQKVFDLLGEEGHGTLILFLCLPFLQPIPLPGLSTPLGFLIILVGYFLARHKAPWIPKKYAHHEISGELLLKVSELAEKIWTYVAKVVRARWVFFLENRFLQWFNFFILLFNCVLLALPLPIPFSNTVPVISIVALAIGSMEKDGLLIFFAYLWSLVVASFFTALTVGAVKIAF